MKVTVITPCNRPIDIPNVVAQFRKQEWPLKELIIIEDQLPGGPTKGYMRETNIWTWPMPKNTSIGAKRNRGNYLASDGSIIVHFDSDDLYAPNYITKCVNHLLDTGADATGLSSLYFFQRPDVAWEYSYSGGQPYVVGSGMCYWRKTWERNPFRDISEGEDAHFCANAGRVIPHNYKEGMIAMIHNQNTASHKQLRHMKMIDPNIVVDIMGKW